MTSLLGNRSSSYPQNLLRLVDGPFLAEPLPDRLGHLLGAEILPVVEHRHHQTMDEPWELRLLFLGTCQLTLRTLPAVVEGPPGDRDRVESVEGAGAGLLPDLDRPQLPSNDLPESRR